MKLIQMTSLTLMNTKVEDISPLSSLTGLTTLNLANSQREAPQITDISPLSQLIELRVIELGGHNISDISPLKDLNYLDQLWLYDNNMTYRHFYELHRTILQSHKAGTRLDLYEKTSMLLVDKSMQGLDVVAWPILNPWARYGDTDVRSRLVDGGSGTDSQHFSGKQSCIR